MSDMPVAREPVGGRDYPVKSYDASPLAGYIDRPRYEQIFSAAKMLASSDLVPAHFRSKEANCFIAIQLAARLNFDPFMVMQSLYVVHGRPGFEGKFVIACINNSGLFQDPIHFEFSGKGDDRVVTVSAKRKGTGTLCSMPFALKTAIDEGWYKQNQKWRTMTEQMMCYRGASFFKNRFCPEVTLGVPEHEELNDARVVEASVVDTPRLPKGDQIADRVNAARGNGRPTAQETTPTEPGEPTREPDPETQQSDKECNADESTDVAFDRAKAVAEIQQRCLDVWGKVLKPRGQKLPGQIFGNAAWAEKASDDDLRVCVEQWLPAIEADFAKRGKPQNDEELSNLLGAVKAETARFA